MTKEEAIKYGIEWLKDEYLDAKDGAFIKIALEALEQEPIAQERYKDLCEYFGNMKDILNSREDFKAWLARVKWHIHKAEELYEKYEQEPCPNAISHTDMLDAIGHGTTYTSEELQRIIKGMPPVNPQEPSNDMVSREVFEQVMWERDLAIEQLKDLGYGLGEKPKTGHWKYYQNEKGDWINECSVCGSDAGVGYQYPYCPNCGTRMR